MGWLSPVIIAAKIFIQTLWLQQLEWDQPVSLTEERVWQRLRDELPLLEQVRVPRWIQISTAGSHAEVHGFADASERAYAAAVNLRVADQESRHSFLLQAKTKVAPVRPISLPRLELCAAALLAKLTVHVTTVMKLTSVPLHLWTDSTVTLTWLKDCASRGLSPKDLLEPSLWWSGPTWLTEEAECPFKEDSPSPPSPLPDERLQIHATTVDPEEGQDTPLLQRFSKLHRLLRMTAWCCRWLEAIRTRHTSSFSGGSLPRRSLLVKLIPFKDEHGIIRVGGRLKHAVLYPDKRHPVILPRGSHFTMLVIEACHQKTLHGGVQLTLGQLRQRYWVPGGRLEIRRLIHRCIPCMRWRVASPQPPMSKLPKSRVRPFTHTGVDYAGPVLVRTAAGRGHKSKKVFFCIFICLATRAVHLELVSDYSTDACIAVFRRFVSRHGMCQSMYSDRGTNFVGADAQLRALFQAAVEDNRQLVELLASKGVEWRFNPPAAPHFGGLIRRPADLAALTPGHFLTGAALTSVPEPSLSCESLNHLTRWQCLQRMRDDFWNKWSREYLQTLNARTKWWKPKINPDVGELIRGEQTPRVVGLWHGSRLYILVTTDRFAWSPFGPHLPH
ncbi:uncharacterized protein LOC105202636 [Solenopsis invicta]|uniref:uncharacterized protein LOC105202636 n=1 Tax=Solenopsis invicta TaxID=13686 RepID=UPI0005962ECA|nr:uncharacterized protein LOC105202636 [Solenopsis invicta]